MKEDIPSRGNQEAGRHGYSKANQIDFKAKHTRKDMEGQDIPIRVTILWEYIAVIKIYAPNTQYPILQNNK